MQKYKIIRFYKSHPLGINNQVVKTGLTLEEAVKHCEDPQTSSSTATGHASSRTDTYGDWFDGYEKSDQKLFTWTLSIEEPGKEVETHINQDLDMILPYLKQRYFVAWEEFQEDPSIYGNFLDFLYYHNISTIEVNQVCVG